MTVRGAACGPTRPRRPRSTCSAAARSPGSARRRGAPRRCRSAGGRRPGRDRHGAPCHRRSTRRRAAGRPTRNAKPITSPVIGRLNGGPWRHGVTVMSMTGRPGASSRVSVHGSRPTVMPSSRVAPARSHDRGRGRQHGTSGRVEVVGVVIVAEQHGVDRRQSATVMAGPTTLRDDAPHPNPYRRPGVSNVGSVSSRHGPISMSAVGAPMWVTWTTGDRSSPRRCHDGPTGAGDGVAGDPGMADRPRQGVIGDLLPALVSRKQVRAAAELDDLGQHVGPVVLRVRPLHLRRHQVVLGAGDDLMRLGDACGVPADPRGRRATGGWGLRRRSGRGRRRLRRDRGVSGPSPRRDRRHAPRRGRRSAALRF